MNFFRYFGIIAAISAALTIFGYWAKITHQSYADKVFTTGMWSLALCAGVYVYIKVSSLRNKK